MIRAARLDRVDISDQPMVTRQRPKEASASASLWRPHIILES
jgi:hypothetical protein